MRQVHLPSWRDLPSGQQAALIALVTYLRYVESEPSRGDGARSEYLRFVAPIQFAHIIARGETELSGYKELVWRGILSWDDGPFVGYVIDGKGKATRRKELHKYARPLGPEDYELGREVPPAAPMHLLEEALSHHIGGMSLLRRDDSLVRWAFADTFEQARLLAGLTANMGRAIHRAENAEEESDRKLAWSEASEIGEHLALITPQHTSQGSSARIDAVRAALRAGDKARAAKLREQYLNEGASYLIGISLTAE